MKNLKIILAIVVLITANSSYAATKTCSADIKVNGLVCDFCARALEKVFGKKDEVSGIKVDLDKGDVVVNFKPGKTIADGELKKLITESGYDVTQIARNECK